MVKISKKNAEHYLWGDKCDGWHLVKNEEMSVIYERMPSHTSEVRHYHQYACQFFFVLSGTATFELEGERIILQSREGIEVPPCASHQMRNESGEDVEFLVISQPNSKGDRVLT